MSIIKHLFGVEWHHLFVLPQKTRTLLTSFILRSTASPFINLFVLAFLWREHSSVLFLASYKIGDFIGLPVGFTVNGFLLRRFRNTTLHLAGSLGQGLVLGFIIFTNPGSISAIFIAGLAYGVVNGLYWGNRNFLTVEYTEDGTRNYFVGLLGAISSIIGIIIPFIAGWLIEAGPIYGTYSAETAYKVVGAIGLLLLYACGAVLLRQDLPTPPVRHIFKKKIGRFWKGVRGTAMFRGLLDGTNAFIPVAMVLTLIGEEGALGTIQSGITILTASLLYLIGRFTTSKDRTKILASGILPILIAGILFAIFGTPGWALLYILVSGLGMALVSAGYAPFELFAVGHSKEKDKSDHYARVLDHEIFLNLGRVIGTGFFIYLSLQISSEMAIRIILPIIGVFEIGLIGLVHILTKDKDLPSPENKKDSFHLASKMHRHASEH